MKTMINRTNLNWDKIGQLSSINDELDFLYGKRGTPEREEFNKDAYALYMSELENNSQKDKKTNKRDLNVVYSD